jgi:putative ABC transport system permease protein
MGRNEAALDRWRRRVRIALPSADDDLVEEVAQHIAERWVRGCEAGMDSAAADRQAEEDLLAWKGRQIPSRAAPWYREFSWSGWGADVRFAARFLRVRPVFTVGAALLSTIAITAILCGFSVVYGILWRPLPYPDSERLAVIWQVRGGDVTQISYPDLTDVTAADVFDGRAAMSGGRGSLRIGDSIDRVNALAIEADGYAMLAARPVVGRLLNAADADRPLAMISHRLWTSKFGSDPSIVGRVLWLSGNEYTVVGVLQPGFDFELPVPPSFKLEQNDIWTILDTKFPLRPRRDVSAYEVLVRIAPQRTMGEAQASADATAQRLAAEYASTNIGRTFRIASLKNEVVGPVRRPMLFVAVASVVTLLVALANLVILGLVRGAERQEELSIRTALGAGAMRIRRQLFAEHLVIALTGAVFGVFAARQVVELLVRSEAAHLPRVDAIRFDAPVWWVAAALTLLLALVMSAQPLQQQVAALRSGSRATSRVARRSRRLMAATEIALALTLTTGGALLALSFSRLLSTDPGFRPAGAASARVSAYDTRYPTKEHVRRFFEDVVGRLRDMPQVTAAGAGSSLPLSGQATGTSIVAEGRPLLPGARPTAGWQFVTPGYFEAAGISVRAGRDFSTADREGAAHVTVVNEDLARRLFPGEDPIGRRIGVGGDDANGDWHEIIGVVADVRHQALDIAPSPRVYDLLGQHWGRTLYVVARTRNGDADSLLPVLRRTVRSLDPDAPVFEAATLETLVDRSAATRRMASTIAVGLAAAGVLLALIGVYAVAAASVAERAREIGVRAALGAAPLDLFRLIARESASTAAWGSLAGLFASLIVVRLLRTQLFGVDASDAMWLIPAVAVGVLAAAAAAAIPPGRRAASVDPLVAMRVD